MMMKDDQMLISKLSDALSNEEGRRMKYPYVEGDELYFTKGPVMGGSSFEETVSKFTVVGTDSGRAKLFIQGKSGYITTLQALSTQDKHHLISASFADLRKQWNEAIERHKEREMKNAENRCVLWDRVYSQEQGDPQ